VRNILLVVALTLTLALANNAFCEPKQHDFQKGKLINVTTDERLIEGTSARWAIFTVQISDLVYTARGGRVRRHSGDFTEGLIIGDPVQAAVDGGELILLKPDGKELKTRIIKRERAQ